MSQSKTSHPDPARCTVCRETTPPKTDQPQSEAEAREAVFKAITTTILAAAASLTVIRHPPGEHPRVVAALDAYKEAVLREPTERIGSMQREVHGMPSRLARLEADNHRLREALEGLVEWAELAREPSSAKALAIEAKTPIPATHRIAIAHRALAGED